MWRIIDPLKLLGRWLLAAARRARRGLTALLEWAGEFALELAAGALALLVLGYALLGPQNVLLLRVGSTAISAPSWVVALLVALVFAVVFWLIVSQLED